MELLNYMATGLQLIIEKLINVCLQWNTFNHESPRRGETFITRKITRVFQGSMKDLINVCI